MVLAPAWEESVTAFIKPVPRLGVPVVLLLSLFALASPAPAQTPPPAGGSGTEDDPYVIDVDELLRGGYGLMVASEDTIPFAAGTIDTILVTAPRVTVANNRQIQQGARWIGDRGWIHVNRGGLNASDPKILREEIGPNETRLIVSRDHKQNFLDCVRSRALPICPVEVGHRSISVGLLGEIAMLTGRKLKWDPDRETFENDPEASALLGRSYREPWTL